MWLGTTIHLCTVFLLVDRDTFVRVTSVWHTYMTYLFAYINKEVHTYNVISNNLEMSWAAHASSPNGCAMKPFWHSSY